MYHNLISPLSYTGFTIGDLDIEAQLDLRPENPWTELNWTNDLIMLPMIHNIHNSIIDIHNSTYGCP